MRFFVNWLIDVYTLCRVEMKRIFHDAGVMIIFGVAGLGYPLLYCGIYNNGVLEDTPVAVVDESLSSYSRRYIREVDATRELRVACTCATMEEAREMMKRRKVNGIIYFPEDFGRNIATVRPAKVFIYADMSSFLYYKNVLMGTDLVMLQELKDIKVERYSAAGMSGQEISQLVEAIPYDENNPYNRTFSYTIFFLSAALLLIIQQVMFYGMTMRSGTAREEGNNLSRLIGKLRGPGVSRVVIGIGAAYWLLFLAVGIYIACIVPAIFGLPQRGSYWDILVLLLFFVTDCVFFALTWSSFFRRRETVMVVLLCMSPIVVFLTGFSWPSSAFPTVWKYFSYIFPTSFGCPAFIDINTAGCDLNGVRELIRNLAVQTGIYCVLSFVATYVEYRMTRDSEA